MYKLDVYFDFVEIGDTIEVGALIIDDGEIVDSKVTAFKNIRGNNYHFSILSWINAIQLLKKYIDDEGDVFDCITFKNQNQLIFKWAESGKYPLDYQKGIEKLYIEVSNILATYQLDFHFVTIKGKDNKVKKMLKKRKDKQLSSIEQKINFSKLINQSQSQTNSKHPVDSDNKPILNSTSSTDNVVNIFDKKQAN